jgi:hypothetical protein
MFPIMDLAIVGIIPVALERSITYRQQHVPSRSKTHNKF